MPVDRIGSLGRPGTKHLNEKDRTNFAESFPIQIYNPNGDRIADPYSQTSRTEEQYFYTNSSVKSAV